MDGKMLEALETRICLDAVQFAGVGYGYMASDWDGYLVDAAAARYDGTVDLDTGAVTYDSWVSAPGGEQASTMGRQVIRNFMTLDDGRVTGIYETNAFDPSFGYPIGAAGTNFLESEGYPIGWSMTEWDVRQVYAETKFYQLLVEKPRAASLAQLSGRWEVVTLFNSWTENILATGTGYFTISGSDVDGQLTFEGGFTLPIDERIQSVRADGLVRQTDGAVLQLSADGNVLLFAGMDTSTTFGIGVAFRRDPQPSRSELAGVYRMGSLWSGDPAWAFNNTAVAIGTSVLELDVTGQYSIYDTAAYDLGSRVPLTQGAWSIQQGRVTLSDGLDAVEMIPAHDARALYITSYGGSPLLSVGVRVVETADYTLSGRANSVVRAGSESDGSGLAVSRNSDGDLVVFQQDGSGWESIRLRDHTDPVQATGDALIWTDPKDGLIYVAGPSDRGFLLYKRDGNGDWSFRNLSYETGAGDITPVSPLTWFVTRPKQGQPQVVVAGLNAYGRIVALQQIGTGSAGAYQWSYYDISADLASQGMATPLFTDLVSYVTSWNQWTLAGLDAGGDVQGVWVNVASFATWRVDNLSRITGADPLTGQLDVTVTPWGGIRFVGANARGRLVGTWWNPGRGPGNWAQTDMSDTVQGSAPIFVGGSLTAWFTPTNTISYAGYDTNGDLISVYWQPGDGGVWSARNLSEELSNRSSRPVGTVTSHVTRSGAVTLAGLSNDRDVVCLWWTPDGADRWQLDNLTASANRR